MRARDVGLVGVLCLTGACGELERPPLAGAGSDPALDSLAQPVTGRICPAGSTVSGIDVSEYQGRITWSAVRAAGYEFAITRIGDGTYRDPTFATNWAEIKAAGMIRGAYQYFEPALDPIAQANIVIAKVGRLGPGDLPVMLDVEATGGQSPATITARIHQWMDAVAAGTGKQPFLYTGAYFWDDNVKSADFASVPINVAWYGTTCPGLPNAWRNWHFHQFSSTGSVSGISGNVDLDVWNGSLAQLRAFAGSSGTPVNPPLYAFARTGTGSRSTEVHALAADTFQTFTVHAATALGETGSDGAWQLLLGDYNRDGVKDLYAISKRGASGRTEVHVLDGASGYKTYSLHAATPLGASGSDHSYTFDLGDYDRDGTEDLFIIQRGSTGTGTTEVHILSGASNFQTWLLHTGSALAPAGGGLHWKFLVGDYDRDGTPDLYAVSKQGGSGQTEVHVLSGAARYQTWLLHTATALGATGSDASWDFALADRDGDGQLDLYALSKVGTGTGSTEVHILSGAGGAFRTWLLHTGTGLGLTGSTESWQFGL